MNTTADTKTTETTATSRTLDGKRRWWKACKVQPLTDLEKAHREAARSMRAGR